MRKLPALLTVAFALWHTTAFAAPAGPASEPILDGDALPFEAAVFLGCDKLPPGKQAVRLDLPAEVPVAELLTFMARVSCSPVRLGDGITSGTKVKFAPAQMVSAQEAFGIVDAAITAAGLSLQAEKSGPGQFDLIVKRPTPAR